MRRLDPDSIPSSILQGGYQHPVSRSWQAKQQLTKSMLMYPIFITDDPDASTIIATLPGQRRWGVNKLEEFIGPLVQKGLQSVILFGVPLTCIKVGRSLSYFKNRCGTTAGAFLIGCSRYPCRRPFWTRYLCNQKATRAIPVAVHRMRCVPVRIHRSWALRIPERGWHNR